jgi:hypothetical protein
MHYSLRDDVYCCIAAAVDTSGNFRETFPGKIDTLNGMD